MPKCLKCRKELELKEGMKVCPYCAVALPVYEHLNWLEEHQLAEKDFKCWNCGKAYKVSKYVYGTMSQACVKCGAQFRLDKEKIAQIKDIAGSTEKASQMSWDEDYLQQRIELIEKLKKYALKKVEEHG